MEAEILKIGGIAVLCAVLAALLAPFKESAGIGVALRLCGTALCLGGALVLLGEAVSSVLDIANEGATAEYAALMIRGLGICVICRICSDICRESGQAGLSGAVETAGKLALVLLALPVVKDILAFADELMERM